MSSKLIRFLVRPDYAGYVLRTRCQRAYNYLRLRTLGLAPPPRMVILQLTGLCNLRCRMCNQWGEKGGYHGLKAEQITLSLPVIESILEEIAPYKPYIQLLGGEPLLHPELPAVLELLKHHQLVASLETNGTTLEKWVPDLVNSTVDTINLSLDGPAPIHDSIRGREGTHAKALEGLQSLFSALQASSRSMTVNIRLTICEENQTHLLASVEQFRDLPINSFTMQHLMFNQPEIQRENMEVLRKIKPMHEEIPMGGESTPPRIDGKQVAQQIAEVTQPGRFPFPVHVNPRYPESYLVQYYQDASRLPDPPLTCRVPTEVLSISCQQEVTICSHFYVGHYPEQSLLGLWNNPLSRRFRKLLLRRGSIPACKICCYPTDE